MSVWKFFWSLYSHNWAEYKDSQYKPPYLAQIQENGDQKNFV